ncbi:MAG: ATP-grasp domain-containing protein [Pirellulales bacterium]|nr:ATP-grasp domain-containing protein [Pirellulales bacterium]
MSRAHIDKVLIANRGEIARRIQRTCRAMGISTVAVFSEPDRRSLFVAEADEAVALGGSTPAESYLRVDALIDAARRSEADAIHPGYGFLAENAEFARAVIEAGLIFIGPSPEAIAAMGSKIEAKRRMQAAGVPILGSVDAGARSAQQLLAEAEKLGYPLLVKASAGGGGRGMRIVSRAEDFPAALEAARLEAKNAFGDDAVFLEPYVESSRHVEIQIFGDQHGNVISLFERECSIQRRHQKIIEESPSPAVDEALRRTMGEAAVQAGRAIKYVGAGTVEFLLTPQGKFYFLEVNTRLQVEHPVTEMITGLDLVRLQILAARGEPLPPEATGAQIQGHAIEVRLCAEDPRNIFLPVTGRLQRFQIEPAADVRVETGVADGAEVSPFYDSMLAKVIVHAPTRADAARRLASVLARAQLHGLRTNRELLVRTLQHNEFLAGQTDTHFLLRHPPAELGRPLSDARTEHLHAAAAALAAQAERRAAAPTLGSIPSGWRNNPSQLQETRYRGESGEIVVGYEFRRGRLRLMVAGEELPAPRLGHCTATQVTLEIDGIQRTYAVHRVGMVSYVDSPLGATELVELPRYPEPGEEVIAGSLVAPLPGLVAEVKVAVDQLVASGETLLVIESMKMLHPITAPAAGRVVEVRVTAKAQVDAGAVLVVIDEQAET